MRIPGKRADDEGILSLDFIIGFTIFMIAFIFVAVMISGLLIQLQSRTIDYDAVAYRTSVVLVEDPGWAVWSGKTTTSWELNDLGNDEERDNVLRIGLSIGRNYERILSANKISKFFSTTSNPEVFTKEEYRDKLIFGDYPYNFNITLKELDPVGKSYVVGDPVGPNTNYGYMRRVVKIKKPNSDIAGVSGIMGSAMNIDANESNQTQINVDINLPELYYLTNLTPPYQIDPLREGFQITVQNFTSFTHQPSLTTMQFSYLDDLSKYVTTNLTDTDYENSVRVLVDGIQDAPPTTNITKNVTIIIDPQYFRDYEFIDEFDVVTISLNFNANVTNQTSWPFNYDTIQSQPSLIPAVLEVRVW